ncbi:response regulator transcription factor [Streptosporangium sp. NPDC000239]|uniref:helix-turn-helix transcriptional regulator n=1 Tax=Streptosporangium sp. NPDC000239 TaxID=3154248 RepID=UPI0033224CB4
MAKTSKACKVTVTLASRNEFRRLGLEQLLQRIPLVESFTSYEGGAELASVAESETDIFIIPVEDLDESLVAFIARLPEHSKTLLLLDRVSDERVSRIAAVPAHGFLSEHDLGVESLADALERVSAGEVPMPYELTMKLLRRAGEPCRVDRDRAPVHLTPREQEVLSLLVDGLSNKQIASRLHLSQHSVKRLVTSILAKLNTPNRTLAVARSLREGLVHRTASREPEEFTA